MKQTVPVPPMLPLRAIGLAWLGAFAGASALGLGTELIHLPFILGSFGASCLLLFAYPDSPFAQPRNVIGGHLVSSLTGLVVLALFGVHWWSMGLGVATAIALMLLLRVPHPPAGSNPFIVMLGAAKWSFLLTPTLLGALLLVMVALIYHRLSNKAYPVYW